MSDLLFNADIQWTSPRVPLITPLPHHTCLTIHSTQSGRTAMHFFANTDDSFITIITFTETNLVSQTCNLHRYIELRSQRGDLHRYIAAFWTLATAEVVIYIGIFLNFELLQPPKWWFTSASCSILNTHNRRCDGLYRYFASFWRLTNIEMMICIGMFLYSEHSQPPLWWFTSVFSFTLNTHSHRNDDSHRYFG
jgi:hypothetical protein